ncbi:MAG TPA: UDP-N-acetylmuramoylalanine--D-glutamate ligase, partial [Candidatus Ornithoclostridium faecavium]|nr:UDP-N-acetylmuramoylalanine--D-glutamate ligase [Candidatus Ornithoclostridium faecavium]
ATLERAVEISLAYKDSKNLLFSPSTSSFDRYTDYVQRGRHFDVIIKAFANG